MAIRIELTPEVEARLREEAAQHGQDVSAFAQALIEDKLGESSSPNVGGETLDKVLAGHIGLINVGPAELPQKAGDSFTDGLTQKYRKQGLTV